MNCEIISQNFSQKNKNSRKNCFVFKNKISSDFFYQLLHLLAKLTKLWAKIPIKINKNNANPSKSHNNLNHDNLR